jgi:hypothetical protein
MKIDLGHGSYLEPDEEPRNSEFHKVIVAAVLIPGTRTGHNVLLQCGHTVQTFGNLEYAKGVAFCTQCRDTKTKTGVGGQ